MLYPTGPGEPRRIDDGSLEVYTAGRWFADGKSVLVCGNATGQAPRCYVRSIDAPALRPVTPEGIDAGVVSPDGKSVAVRSVTGKVLLCPLDGGAPRPLPFITADERLSRVSPDGTAVWVRHGNRAESVDLVSGRRETVVQTGTAGGWGGAGMITVDTITVADDPRAYVYSATERSSRLFEIEGVR